MYKIGIIGGGASGLMAAIVAAREGMEVTVIERQNRIGKKILVTGNGRCNMTHTDLQAKHFHTHSKKNPYEVVEGFNYDDTLAFFESLGIEPLIEKGKVYPLSEQASSVLDVMRLELEQLGVTVCVDECVTSLKYNEGWQVKSAVGNAWTFDRIILATGGKAAPQLGCDEVGYGLLEKLGHHTYTTYPTLVHMTSPTPYCKMMQGIRVKGKVSVLTEGRVRREELGEVLFTEDGLSGPPIFQLSRVAAEASMKKTPCEVHLDLFPNLDEETLIGKFYERIGSNPSKTIEELFVGWLHKKVAIPVIKQSEVGSPVAPGENLDYEMIGRLARSMKCLVFNITGTRGFKFAQATAGGISLDEIDLTTMASMKAPHLYVTGEVLDVDGDCGGYNLQWAWSTGYRAAKAAAR
ncbi:MAG: NAD(P)/FAD-dependent oxidoreductase [Cellulosilyticaceae bacterium]